jgi:hypothetical protein
MPATRSYPFLRGFALRSVRGVPGSSPEGASQLRDSAGFNRTSAFSHRPGICARPRHHNPAVCRSQTATGPTKLRSMLLGCALGGEMSSLRARPSASHHPSPGHPWAFAPRTPRAAPRAIFAVPRKWAKNCRRSGVRLSATEAKRRRDDRLPRCDVAVPGANRGVESTGRGLLYGNGGSAAKSFQT